MMRILVVDDDQDMCEILSDLLREEGYSVLTAYTGESALRNLQCTHYDLLILDYKLRGTNGLQVLEEVYHINAPPTIIMMSAFGSEQVRLQARDLGVYDFIEKPFDMERMVAVVNQALRHKR
jgi:DNA-binding response OmpR family regulator